MTSSTDILPPLSSVPAHIDGDIVTDLTRWITEQRRKKAVRFVLAQRGSDSSAHQPVNEWSTDEFEDARDLAEAIYGTAVREAQALKTSLAYGVFSARLDRPDNIGRTYFRVEAGTGWMPRLVTDAPDERNVLAMLMSHADASARLSLGHSHDVINHHERLQEQTVAHYTRLLEQAYARIALLETRETEALVSRDQLRVDARARELELAQEANKTKERLAFMDKLAQLAPMVLSKLGRGGELSPTANVAAALDVLEQFIDSIDAAQFPQILALLRPQQLQLLELLHDFVRVRKNGHPKSETPPATAAQGAAESPPPATPEATAPAENS